MGKIEPKQLKRLEKGGLEVCAVERAPVSSHYWLNQRGMEALVCFLESFTPITLLLSQLLVASDPWIYSRSLL